LVTAESGELLPIPHLRMAARRRVSLYEARNVGIALDLTVRPVDGGVEFVDVPALTGAIIVQQATTVFLRQAPAPRRRSGHM